MGAGPSAADRAAHRWSAQGARERALQESVARHPAALARARRAAVAGASVAGAPNRAVRTPGCVTSAPATAAMTTTAATTAAPARPAPAATPARPRTVAVPVPRTVRPLDRRCLVPARPRPARSRVRGRLERLLSGAAVLLCATTAVVALGLLGDVAAGWNASSGASSVSTVR